MVKKERCVIASSLLNFLGNNNYKSFSLDNHVIEISLKKNLLSLYIDKTLKYAYDLKREEVIYYEYTELGSKILEKISSIK